MWPAPPQPDAVHPPATPAAPPVWYSILGVDVAVVCDVEEALQQVDETYAAFRSAPSAPGTAFVAELRRLRGEDGCLVSDSHGRQQRWPSAHAALLDVLDRIVHGVLARLHAQGIYAIHAGAVVYEGAALIVAGRSGQGKTTLVLGLLRRGLGLLSDEFAIVEQATRQLLPYRRSLHIRPGTPELIPELGFLRDRPRRQLGGGIEWVLAPGELEQALPGCLARPAPLRFVLLLDGAPWPAGAPALTPVPAALATMELLRGTWAASVDFTAGLERVGRLLGGARCARLRAAALDPTLDCITQWLERQRG
jgi:hypothetical protein